MENERDDKWKHLCLIADKLDELIGTEKIERERVLLIESILEVFSKELDPVSEYEAYAVRCFAKALRSTFISEKSD